MNINPLYSIESKENRKSEKKNYVREKSITTRVTF